MAVILNPNYSPTWHGPRPYVIDWQNPLTRGLQYIYSGNNNVSQAPLFTKYANGTFAQRSSNKITSSLGAGGVGLSADAAAMNFGVHWAGGAPTLNQATGTMMMYQTQGFADSDGVDYRFAFRIADGSENGMLFFHVVGSALILYGWYSGGATYASSTVGTSLGGIGSTSVVGFTWQKPVATWVTPLWINGTAFSASTPNTATPFDTTGLEISIGNDDSASGTTRSWLGTTNGIGKLYWMAFWDRVLGDDELIFLNANPMCFLIAPDEMPAITVPGAGPSFIAAWALGSNLPVLGTGNF